MVDFSLTLNNGLSAINSRSLLSALNSSAYPSYGIYYAKGKLSNVRALDFSSVVKVDISSEATITNAPVSSVNGVSGSYSSINKIVQPSKINMRISVEGMTAYSGSIPRVPKMDFSKGLRSVVKITRADLIDTLEKMKNSPNVYNIETPDRVYPNFDLINYKFVTEAKSGATLLQVDLSFQEVRTLTEVMEVLNRARKSVTTKVSNPTKRAI